MYGKRGHLHMSLSDLKSFCGPLCVGSHSRAHVRTIDCHCRGLTTWPQATYLYSAEWLTSKKRAAELIEGQAGWPDLPRL
jgi:hypothetical protein